MDSSAISWLSELELDNSVFLNHQQEDFMDSFDEDLAALAFGQEYLQNHLSQGMNNSSSSSCSTLITSTPSNSICNNFYVSSEMQHHIDLGNSYSNFSTISTMNLDPPQVSSLPVIMTFGNKDFPENLQQVNTRPLNPEEKDVVAFPEVLTSPGTNIPNGEATKKRAQPAKKKTRVRPPSQTYDHIIAERKRREQLSQLFVALSAIVPGLKKMDKSSVLEHAIKYLKHLQERVKYLEEQAETLAKESVVIVKRSRVVVDDDEDSSDEISGVSEEQPLPEIEARVCNNHILLRVHCEKQKGVLANLLSKVESLNMSVITANATPFGNIALDITIVAELEKEFKLTVKEVLIALRAALQKAA